MALSEKDVDHQSHEEDHHVSPSEEQDETHLRPPPPSGAGDLESGSTTSPGGGDEKPPDPNIIGWDGPTDPENPMNWKTSKKILNVGLVSFMCFLTPLASSMFAPAVPTVMAEFHSNNLEMASFIVSVFVLGFAFGPVLLGPLSEVWGRLYLYWICNILFVVFTAVCAKSNSIGMLTGFRFLCGFVGGLPLAVGGGTITDMMSQDNRGAAMALFSAGPLLGPIIGPVAGGFLSEAKGWRWVFWLLTIAVCVTSLRQSY
jgi:multidrug resistance protein